MSKDKVINDGGPAFPRPLMTKAVYCKDGALEPVYEYDGGMTLRDYFAIHAPEPSEDEVSFERRLDKNNNPYNESHKPKLRGDKEIRVFLRYKFADAMLAERSK